jgi:hypothetical protein
MNKPVCTTNRRVPTLDLCGQEFASVVAGLQTGAFAVCPILVLCDRNFSSGVPHPPFLRVRVFLRLRSGSSFLTRRRLAEGGRKALRR